jgi:Cdc6-like AAA superfamily ATPase
LNTVYFSCSVKPRQPVEFVKVMLDGVPMMVSKSIPGSSIIGPMFLSEPAYQQLRQFVLQPELNQALVVLGPPKSSKTTVLHEVLPSLAAAHAVDIAPLFVKVAFSLNQTPQTAVERIWSALKGAADLFGIKMNMTAADLPVHRAGSFLPQAIGSLANALQEHKHQLWLLIDEVQVCVFNHSLFLLNEQALSLLFPVRPRC